MKANDSVESAVQNENIFVFPRGKSISVRLVANTGLIQFLLALSQIAVHGNS